MCKSAAHMCAGFTHIVRYGKVRYGKVAQNMVSNNTAPNEVDNDLEFKLARLTV